MWLRRELHGTRPPLRVIIDSLMKRRIGLTIALFYLLGNVVLPAAAYSCVDCGVAGVVTYLATSPTSCYAVSCCDEDRDRPKGTLQAEIPCCDLDVQTVPDRGRLLLPDQKKGQAGPPSEAPVRLDEPRPRRPLATAIGPTSMSRASINSPLLI